MGVFYITTPIYYPNAPPHIGHAYTTIYADVLARYNRLRGNDTFFLTGNDEHGLKIQRIAEKLGKNPKEFVDEMAEVYKGYWRSLNISYDYFIRTTDPSHEEVVKKAFTKIYEKGLIYKAKYGGYYCVDCETYYNPGEYIEVEGRPYCPIHNKPLEYLEEETYYFKLSEFRDYLTKLLSEPGIIVPDQYRREVLSKLELQGLKDISVARPVHRVSWGVPVPFDPNYVVYVWFDALLNYISAINYGEDEGRFRKYWGSVHHVIGKDILWFHTAVWFSILRALDIDPPKRLLVHAFLINRGLKIGKSAGNVISIEELLSRYYTSDGVRYVLMRIFNMEKDSEASFELLDSIYNSELADTYGNLVRRVGTLAMKKSNKVYRRSMDKAVVDKLSSSLDSYITAMDNYDVSKSLEVAMDLAKYGNQLVNEWRPWEKRDPSKELYSLLEIIRYVTVMLAPVMPEATAKVARAFGFAIEDPGKLSPHSTERYDISDAPILFKKVKAA